MTGFLDRMLGRNKGSSSTAKDRLKFVLIHDRIDLPPERLTQMKEEILAVISKYVSVDRERVDIALEQRNRNSKLVAEIPFVKGSSGTQSSTDEPLISQTKQDETPLIDKESTVDSTKESTPSEGSTDSNSDEQDDNKQEKSD